VVTIHTLLASTGSGLDQSANTGNPTPTSYLCHGCLNSSRGVIFLGSHRFALARKLQERDIDPLPLLEVIHRLTERMAATPAPPASLNGCP
jgi:hypothetical protein